MSTILCIDTASSAFALALAIEGEVAGTFVRDAEQDHSRRLLAAIDDLLGGRKRDLSGLAVVTGPGSYAGLRVGIATAEALALARGIPIAGIGTMEAIVRASGIADGSAIHPAGRGQFAVQDVSEGRLTGPLRQVAGPELQGLRCVGEGAADFGGIEVGPEARCRAALELALRRLGRPADGAAIEAIYLREPHITVSRRQAALRQSTPGEPQ